MTPVEEKVAPAPAHTPPPAEHPAPAAHEPAAEADVAAPPAGDRGLSKNEMDALLAAAMGPAAPGAAEKVEGSHRVHVYDFRQPSRFNKAELEKLRKLNDSLGQAATQQVTKIIQGTVKLQLDTMDHLKWENLRDELAKSSVGFVFQMIPPGHRGLVAIDRPLASCYLEKTMGGSISDKGHAATDPIASFTSLDVRVLSNLVRIFVDPLPQLWEKLGKFQVQLGAFVQDMKALDIFAATEDMFRLTFQMQGNAGSGRVSVIVPFEAVRQLPPKSDDQAKAAGSSENWLRESVKKATVEVTVLLGATDVKVERLVQTQPGDVIILDKGIAQTLVIRLNSRSKLRGYPGIVHGKMAVKLVHEG